MPRLKSARHHWWPECLSAKWTSNDGKTGWVRPDGTCIRIPPKDLGVIGNAHHIKLASTPGDSSPWDTTFESEFDRADTNFPAVISWLESLPSSYLPNTPATDRFLGVRAGERELKILTECVVSLAVRGPMNREASVALAEHFRGRLPSPERDALIGANMRQSQRIISDSIGANAKFVVLISQSKEFIFGDGFFHNVRAVVNPPAFPKILAPITPNISVLIVRPPSFTVHPVLSTIVLSDDEIDFCNHTVQVYARNALYFRRDQPTIEDVFKSGEHLQYADSDNSIEILIRSIPGVPPKDAFFDFLTQAGARKRGEFT